MAQLDHPFDFTGRIGKLVFYRKKMSDKVIVREARGATAQQIKNDPKYRLTRLNNSEFKARNILCKAIYRGLSMLKPVFDYNIYNALMSVASKMQKLEDIHGMGERGLYFSRFGKWMEGMALNRKTSWESVVRAPFEVSFDKTNNRATISIPELIPGVHFQQPTAHPYYQFFFSLIAVPDVIWNGQSFETTSTDQYNFGWAETPWHRASQIFPGTELTVETKVRVEGTYTLLLASAVCVGNGEEAAQYVGTGKIDKVYGL